MLSYIFQKIFNRNTKLVHVPILEWQEVNDKKYLGYLNGKYQFKIEEKMNDKTEIDMIMLTDNEYLRGWFKDIQSAKNEAERIIHPTKEYCSYGGDEGYC